MRRVILILVGLAVVASLPTLELTREDLLQLLHNNRPEDNDLFHNNEETQPKEDVLRGEGQVYAPPSVQVQEPTVQEIANDAEQQDQVQQPEAKLQQEGSDSHEKQNGQEEVPKVEQEETEPEGEQIKEETEPEGEEIKEDTEPEGQQIKEEPQVEVKQTDEANVEMEQVSPSEPVEQVPLVPGISQLNENLEFDNAHITRDDSFMLEGEDINEPYPDYPTEVEGPADGPPLQDDVSLVDFFIPIHETLIYEGAPEEEFFHEEVPEEEFPGEEVPKEEFPREEVPEEEFSHEEIPEEGFSREEVPEEGFFRDEVTKVGLSHEEVPEEGFSHEVPTDETDVTIVIPGADYFVPPGLESEFVPDDTPANEPPLQDDVSLVDFFIPIHETLIYEGAPEEEFPREEVPEEEFPREEVPEEEFPREEVPQEEFSHEEVPEEGFFPEEVPEEEFSREVPKEGFFHEEVPEEGLSHEEVPEEGFSLEFPTDETDVTMVIPGADYFVPTGLESEFVPDDTPIIIIEEEPPPHFGYSWDAYSELSLNPALLEPLMPRFPVERYAEYARFPLDIMEDSPDVGEPFFIPEREDTSSNSDGDVVDNFVIDATPQGFENTNVTNMSVTGEQVILEEQPAPIAEYLEQLVPIAEYPGENYQEPVMVDEQTHDDDRIIFPDDTEPPRNLPIFPHQWNEDSHFTPPKEQQTTPNNPLHLLPVTGETETENMPPREDDDLPLLFPLQPEMPPHDIPDFINSQFPQVPMGSVVPMFESKQERDDTNPGIYLGPSIFQNFVPSSSKKKLNNYNTIRQPSSAEYAIPHHIHRPVDFPQHFNGPSDFPEHFHGPSGFPEHFHGPSGFPEHFHGPSGFPQHFNGPSGFPQHFNGPSGLPQHFNGPSGVPEHRLSRPEMFSDMPNSDFNFYERPIIPQNRDTQDFHSQSPTGQKTLVQGPIMHYEPFYGPNGEPPMRESSPLFRTSSMSTPDDDSLSVSFYSSSPPQYPAFNFLRRPYFRTQYSSSYEDPVYVGPAMYPNTGLYPPTPTHSRYAPNFITQQNPDPSHPYPITW